MRIATVNCGSSSVKAALFDVSADQCQRVSHASRTVEQIDGYAAMIDATLGDILSVSSVEIDAVGHRVVFGGAYARPTIIDDDVRRAIDTGRRVAPVHNGLSLEGIDKARQQFTAIPMVAVFDTSFHATLPAVAAHYALPQELTLKHGLRRYGYHGIAHRSMTERYAELAGAATASVSIITLQLGSGCSATAVRDGVSVDTSMGFTPVEGLMMGTRSGDVDPGALLYLLRDVSMPVDELDALLNDRSGLLGVSGRSSDMATLLHEEAEGQSRAHTAIEMFCYRVRKYIGAYIAVLGHVQAIIFGGGIGERSPEIRRRICEPLGPLGVCLDQGRNNALSGVEGAFSTDDSSIAAWVISSDEERIIARDTFDLIARSNTGGRTA